MKRSGMLAIPLSAAVAAFFAVSCGEGPTTVAELEDPRFHHRSGHGGGPGNGGGGDEGGKGQVNVEFRQVRGQDIAVAAVAPLSGENNARHIDVQGPYQLTYDLPDVVFDPGGACEGLDWIRMFDGVLLDSDDAEITADREANGAGKYEVNDRVRVRIRNLPNPVDPSDPHLYNVRFGAKPDQEDFDPDRDVSFDDSDPDWTRVTVSNQAVRVRQQALDGSGGATQRCPLVAHYTFFASK